MAKTGTTFALTGECQECLALAESFINHTKTALGNGSITVENVNSLQEHADKFASVTALSNKATYEETYKLIQLRCKEVEAVKEKSELVTKFTSLCHMLQKGKLHSFYMQFV